jgi:hypothetical protein
VVVNKDTIKFNSSLSTPYIWVKTGDIIQIHSVFNGPEFRPIDGTMPHFGVYITYSYGAYRKSASFDGYMYATVQDTIK